LAPGPSAYAMPHSGMLAPGSAAAACSNAARASGWSKFHACIMPCGARGARVTARAAHCPAVVACACAGRDGDEAGAERVRACAAAGQAVAGRQWTGRHC